MDSDLEILIRDRATIISPADVKSYMQMVLQSLLACKQHWVLHRDIKPSNFLISMQGEALLAISNTHHCILQTVWPVRYFKLGCAHPLINYGKRTGTSFVIRSTLSALLGAAASTYAEGYGALVTCQLVAGGMKLTDFGLARLFGSPESGRYTNQVLSL